MARMVQCAKLGKEAEALDFPPLPGELGKRIYEKRFRRKPGRRGSSSRPC